MKCPVCWRCDVDLNRAGCYAMHRAPRRDCYSFCPMSGQPYSAAVAEHLEGLDLPRLEVAS